MLGEKNQISLEILRREEKDRRVIVLSQVQNLTFALVNS